jgi:hypothetical protein
MSGSVIEELELDARVIHGDLVPVERDRNAFPVGSIAFPRDVGAFNPKAVDRRKRIVESSWNQPGSLSEIASAREPRIASRGSRLAGRDRRNGEAEKGQCGKDGSGFHTWCSLITSFDIATARLDFISRAPDP